MSTKDEGVEHYKERLRRGIKDNKINIASTQEQIDEHLSWIENYKKQIEKSEKTLALLETL